jgi:5-methyltetrahydropteroyltriglutamate--homocysteine methyltransferase
MPKAFLTTVVGSMPKRPWLMRDRIALDGKKDHFGKGPEWVLEGTALSEAQDDAVRVVVSQQEQAGIDIISDGEQRRTNYVTTVVRGLDGFDFESLKEKTMRAGRRKVLAGRCIGEIKHTRPLVVDDVKFLKSVTNRKIKATLPAPMTIVDSINDDFYGDPKSFAFAWAEEINKEARLLEAAGADVIQFDEPVFSRYPDEAADWGIEALDRCVDGLSVTTAVHICYGYPQPGLERPIPDAYPTVVAALERSKIDQLALEFEGSKLNPEILKLCPTKTVLFGCVFNSDGVMETAEHVADRLLKAAEALSPEQIQAAPDCGLAPMSPAKAFQKLKVMCEGAALARKRAGLE